MDFDIAQINLYRSLMNRNMAKIHEIKMLVFCMLILLSLMCLVLRYCNYIKSFNELYFPNRWNIHTILLYRTKE